MFSVRTRAPASDSDESMDDHLEGEVSARLVSCAPPSTLPPTLLAHVVAEDAQHVFIEHRAVRHRAAVVRGLLPEVGDRVLVTVLDHEPLVTAIVDGARWRRRAGAAVEAIVLPEGASLDILDALGHPLASVTRREDGGVTLRLPRGDARLEAQGRLELVGSSVVVAARNGDVAVNATDHVKVQGETISLN